jgi:MMP 1-O-methyltransferase
MLAPVGADHAKSPGPLLPIRIGPMHPLRRGAFAAVVLCGDRDILGELAGEATARIARKFVLPDLALDAESDFARSSGATLPEWSQRGPRPTPGVCFVFTRADHPAVAALQAQAAGGDTVVIATGLCDDPHAEPLSVRLERFVSALPKHGRVALLGYGHQGRAIAARLRDEFAMATHRVVVCDTNTASRAVAERDGFVTREECLLEDCNGVIASPLDSFAPIASVLAEARERAIPVFDNARPCSGLQHWTQCALMLDEAAARTLRADHGRLAVQTTAAGTLKAHIVREDVRMLAGQSIRHVLSGQTHSLEARQELDITTRWAGDGHAPGTWAGFQRAFVSLGQSGDLGMFAARELCRDLWPQATQRVFPSQHVIDLGTTEFERLLKAHLDGREIVATMQTPAQRVVLGVAAAHYAADRPIIEIGSALGGSGLHMAAATGQHQPLIHSIDPDAPTRDIMRFALDRAGYASRLVQITQTSDQAIADLSDLRGRCGLVFIDGLHTADAIRRDFENYAPLVASGGALLFHDVCPAIHTVMQAVVERVLPDERFRARCLVDGLLVLERVPER